MDSLHQATIGYVQETVSELDDWWMLRRTLQEQHRTILAALRDRRGQDASDALHHHVTWFFSLSDHG